MILALMAKLAVLWTLGLAATALLRRRSAAHRELVWRAVCVSALALPVLVWALPRWSPVAPAAATPVVVASELSPVPAGTFAPRALPPIGAPAVEAAPTARTTRVVAAPSSFPLSSLLLTVWLVGALLVFWPWIAGARALRRAWPRATRLTGGVWHEELARIPNAPGLEIAVLEEVHVPLVWGNRLLLPVEAQGWERAWVRSALLHELAHLERRDGIARLVARLALAVSWPVPMAWWGWRRMRSEAERACDDAALTAGTAATSYAEHLLAIALAARADSPIADAVPAMARGPELDERIAGILDPSRPRHVRSSRAARALVTVGCLALLPLAAFGQDDPAGDEGAVERTSDRPGDLLARGLDWLVASQDETGAWKADIGYKLNQGYRTLTPGTLHVGVTAAAVLAYLEAGVKPGEDPRGRSLVRAGQFLVSSMDNDPGYAQYGGSRMKSHGLALEALAGLLVLTGDEDLRAAVGKAVEFTCYSQSPSGGWRYAPFSQDTDILHAASLLRALEAAGAAGVEVPEENLERARDYVAGRMREQPLGFGYQEGDHARVTVATTAAGLSALRHDGRMERSFRVAALALLPVRLAELEKELGEGAITWHSRDRAARALFTWCVDLEDHQRWAEFRERLHRDLTASQRPDGGWECEGGPGGAYATAVACRILALEPAASKR